MKRKVNNRWYESNRDSRIVAKENTRRTVVTSTQGRDEGTLFVEAATKRQGLGSTRLFIRDGEGQFLALNGAEARTLYRTLQKHFEVTSRVV